MRMSSFLFMKVLVFFLLCTLSCEKGTGLIGKYVKKDNNNRTSDTINLELMPNGKGSWTTKEDTVSFKWEIRGGGGGGGGKKKGGGFFLGIFLGLKLN